MRPRVAIAHDYFLQWGGAERLFGAFAEVFPDAPVYTTLYRPEYLPPTIAETRIHASFLQRFPLANRLSRAWLPLYPVAVSSLDFGDSDVIVSSSSAWMKCLNPRGALHVCYCHSLMKWVWQVERYFTGSYGTSLRAVLTPLLNAMRRWDLHTTSEDRVKVLLTNSETTRSHISRFWGREAKVVHPGIDLSRFDQEARDEGFLLIVSRLVPYKRVDLAVQVCSSLGLTLKIVGDGPDLQRLRRLAGPTTTFLGRCTDREVVQLMARCSALLFPGEEDFGMTPVEAMASGKPVLALGRGGALETVVAGETGEFFDQPTAESLGALLVSFDPGRYSPERCRARAAEFSVSAFRSRLRSAVMEAWRDREAKGLVS